jgi:threonine aldolase
MSVDVHARFRAAARRCTGTIGWSDHATPAAAFQALAEAATTLGIDEWDQYDERGAVARLETEVAALLGTAAAAFFPSGVMAQQAALRTWCDRSGTRRVAMPDLSHLLVHELDGPRILHGFIVEHLTVGATVATAAHLAAIPGRLGAVLVELPLRDAGCLLPGWDELVALSAAARARGVPLHLDGARLWEAQPFWGRPLDEIAALADTVYVSFYKGLGGLAGACLAGATDVIDEARCWRRRLGGTIYRTTPEAVAALAGLRTRLPLMAACHAWAVALAAALGDTVTCSPAVPHANAFLVFAAGDADAVNERLLTRITATGVRLGGPWEAAPEPGRVTAEITVGDGALALDPTEVAGWIADGVG